jgi:hypothetical protein
VYEGQESVDEVVVDWGKVLEFLYSWGRAEVLVELVLLEGRLGLVDFCCEAVVGCDYECFYIFVVSVNEVRDGGGYFCVEGAESVLESCILFLYPCESALFDVDRGG